ncbi:MAG: divergent PAP2 family protein [Clostridiaceae bacterium]|jgi:acid phosphatase family membrane protein YuiD|nr:divergent PAP2 family protein [Clostridiaceae bacterium]
MIIWDMFANRAFIVPVITWFVAQSIKFITHFIKKKKIDFKKFISSGGMPSSHTAITVSLTTIMGIHNGFDSDIFAVSLIFSFIVMADAAGLRRAAGKQAEVLNKLVNSNEHIQLDKELKVLLGHTPIEVIAGAALGIITGIIFN